MSVPQPSIARTIKVPVYRPQEAWTAVRHLSWSPRHPLDANWYFIDATKWCADIDDTIALFIANDVSVSGPDQTLSVIATGVVTGGLIVGMRFSGGTSGSTYTITALLNGATGAQSEAFDISLPVLGTMPAQVGKPWSGQFNSKRNAGAYYIF
jgi:hypothetical protein